MDADNTGNAYARMASKGYNYEVNDGAAFHPAGAPHMSEIWDSQLNKYVFAFSMHLNYDKDPTDATKTDRQRDEMKVDGNSPASMQIYLGDTQTNRWKFKLDAGFQASSNFTHIHQIKAGTGTGWTDTDNPIITFTARKGSPDKFELNYIAPNDASSNTQKLASIDLTPFKGNWVDVIEKVTYNNTLLNGLISRYYVTITKVSDGITLFCYSDTTLQLYRNLTVGFNRQKYGIYRGGLPGSATYLRDEVVLFADFSSVKGAAENLPSAPSNLTAIAVSSSQINLSFTDNSNNEDQFRIDRSSDGTTWSYLTTAPTNSTSYSDTGLAASSIFYYRIRAENTYGNSSFSDPISAATLGITGVGREENNVPRGFALTSHPNPFNPATVISFQLSVPGFVEMKIFDVLGKEVQTLVHQSISAGMHEVTWNASGFGSGVYFCRLQSGGDVRITKMVLVR
jgi:hypothetical protein